MKDSNPTTSDMPVMRDDLILHQLYKAVPSTFKYSVKTPIDMPYKVHFNNESDDRGHSCNP